MAKFGFEQGIGFVPFAGVGYGAFKALRKDDASPVRTAALDALAHRGGPSILPQVAQRLDDENDAVRYTAAATLLHLSDVRGGGGRSKTQ